MWHLPGSCTYPGLALSKKRAGCGCTMLRGHRVSQFHQLLLSTVEFSAFQFTKVLGSIRVAALSRFLEVDLIMQFRLGHCRTPYHEGDGKEFDA